MPVTPLSARKERVPTDFNRVARHYDRLTRANPGYVKHLSWSARRLEQRSGARLLDLCCGTGLSTEALINAYHDAEITALDGSRGMIEAAQQKPFADRVRWLEGDAMDPTAAGAEGPFDGILMAYGIRNMPDIDACLARLFTLLRPGGVICFHEYSVADSTRSKALWNIVSCSIIIPAGLITSPRSDIYRYLRRSVLTFDGVRAFERRLALAGFDQVRTLPMDGWQKGIVHSFVAQRPEESSS